MFPVVLHTLIITPHMQDMTSTALLQAHATPRASLCNQIDIQSQANGGYYLGELPIGHSEQHVDQPVRSPATK